MLGHFGETLERRREQRGWTRRELAGRVGFATAVLRGLESQAAEPETSQLAVV